MRWLLRKLFSLAAFILNLVMVYHLFMSWQAGLPMNDLGLLALLYVIPLMALLQMIKWLNKPPALRQKPQPAPVPMKVPEPQPIAPQKPPERPRAVPPIVRAQPLSPVRSRAATAPLLANFVLEGAQAIDNQDD
jgi:hypothetical protein